MLNPTARAQVLALQALALAYLGRQQEAVREGSAALEAAAGTGFERFYIEFLLARIHLLVGEPEKALHHLEQVVAKPFFVTRSWLKIDPTFAPLRGNPRFERLVNSPDNR